MSNRKSGSPYFYFLFYIILSGLWILAGNFIFREGRELYILWLIAGWLLFPCVVAVIKFRKIRDFKRRYSSLSSLQEQNEQFKRLYEITYGLTRFMPRRELLEMIVEYAHEITDSVYVSLSRVNWDDKTVAAIATTTDDNPLVKKCLSIIDFDPYKPVGMAQKEEIYKSGEIFISDRLSDVLPSCLSAEKMDMVQRLGQVRIFVEIPLMGRDGAFGSLTFLFQHKHYDIDVLKIFAELCAQALNKAKEMEILSTKENMLAKIVERSTNAVIITREDGYVNYMNKTAQKLMDCKSSRDPDHFIQPFLSSDKSVARGIIIETRDGAGWNGDLAVRDKTGKMHAMLLSSFMIRSGAEASRLVFVFTDISVQKDSEKEIERKNIELGITNSELVKSNMNLKQLSRMKSNFISLASHELKTPLTSIKGYVDMIVDHLKDKMDPSVFKMIESVSRAANRLHISVKEILEVSRIDQKRLKLNLKKQPLLPIINESIEELNDLAEQRNITIRNKIPEGLPDIYTESSRLLQVFSNIISNSIKFSPDGKEIVISASEKNELLYVTITDQGIGINLEEQEKIFSPFYEASEIRHHSSGASKFMGKGMGLGLAIASEIIKLHGGKIWVKSECMDVENCPGSEFYITLPTKPRVSEHASVETGGDREETRKDSDKHILLIITEDEKVLEDTNEMLGNVFDVQHAATGSAGIQEAFRLRPTLIMIGDELRGLSAQETCKILKSQSETSQIMVVFFTSKADRKIMEAGYEAGAEDFIMLPFDSKRLTNKVLELLMQRKYTEK